ncbi:MAG TPA: hypothetical protein VGD65_24190 [Chryseosolibacter sp.]
MSIKLTKPYKIAPLRAKRYEAHYNMPAANSLVVPLREFGDEVSCDIRWQDSNGELQLQQNKIFVSQNLVPLNPLLDTQLHELWQHYYDRK